MLVLDSVPGRATWTAAFREACSTLRLPAVEEHDSTTPYVTLPGSYDEFRASFKKSLKRNLNRRWRQLREAGEVGFERHRGSDVTPELIRRAAEIERVSWKGEQGLGIFRDDGGLELHTRILAEADRGFEPDLAFLTVDGRRVVFQYGFVQGECYYAYNTSFDPEYHGFSPGMLVLDALIRELIDEGVTTCDLLVGGDTYKRDLTSDARANVRLIVFNRTLYGRLLRLAHALKTLVKRVVRRGDA